MVCALTGRASHQGMWLFVGHCVTKAEERMKLSQVNGALSTAKCADIRETPAGSKSPESHS